MSNRNSSGQSDLEMSKLRNILKPLMPILAAVYGLMIIYMTALPMADGNEALGRQVLTWLLTLVAIALTYMLIHRGEPRVFPEAKQFSLRFPKPTIGLGVLLLAPLWCVAEGYVVYGLTSLIHTVHLEPISYTPEELHEDLLASIHAVLLAPVLEELCYRQLPISPFQRRRTQVIVCLVMAQLFGIVHVRNFLGASLAAMLYGLVFIWTRNIWYAVILHAGHNLTATLLAVYCMLGLGQIRMSKMPVIILSDAKIVVAAVVLAIVGLIILQNVKEKK